MKEKITTPQILLVLSDQLEEIGDAEMATLFRAAATTQGNIWLLLRAIADAKWEGAVEHLERLCPTLERWKQRREEEEDEEEDEPARYTFGQLDHEQQVRLVSHLTTATEDSLRWTDDGGEVTGRPDDWAYIGMRISYGPLTDILARAVRIGYILEG